MCDWPLIEINKNKNSYYYSSKTLLKGQHGARLGLTIDMIQYKNKNDYYHSFKTQLKSRLRTRPESWVRMVNLGWPKSRKKSKQPHLYIYQVNGFFTYVLSLVDRVTGWLEFMIGSSRINSSSVFLQLGLVQISYQYISSQWIFYLCFIFDWLDHGLT
jgi:hypothetical protein